MTSTAATTNPSAFTPLIEGGREPPREPPSEVRIVLRHDQAELQREVILWQRWVRYLALAVVVAVGVLMSPDLRATAMRPLLAVGLLYAACVFGTGVAVQRSHATRTSAFYFGSALSVYAALLAAGIYLLIGEILPPFVPGPRPVSSAVNVSLFAMVAAVLIYTFGSFRARMNQLRMFCKLVEEGDLATGLDLAKAKFPDDLTLLARSFDAMRHGLAEQIGTDPLTGCLNRRSLEARLRSDWRLAKRRRVDDFSFGPPRAPLTITVSVGVALARGTDPISPEELLKEADRGLYKAKQQGRNRVFA